VKLRDDELLDWLGAGWLRLDDDDRDGAADLLV